MKLCGGMDTGRSGCAPVPVLMTATDVGDAGLVSAWIRSLDFGMRYVEFECLFRPNMCYIKLLSAENAVQFSVNIARNHMRTRPEGWGFHSPSFSRLNCFCSSKDLCRITSLVADSLDSVSSGVCYKPRRCGSATDLRAQLRIARDRESGIFAFGWTHSGTPQIGRAAAGIPIRAFEPATPPRFIELLDLESARA